MPSIIKVRKNVPGLKSFFDQSRFSDITIVVDQNVRVAAHKVLLSAFSRVLAEAFDETSGGTGIVEVRGSDS